MPNRTIESDEATNEIRRAIADHVRKERVLPALEAASDAISRTE
jgi:hypothetical protein